MGQFDLASLVVGFAAGVITAYVVMLFAIGGVL